MTKHIKIDMIRDTIIRKGNWIRDLNLPWTGGIYPMEMAAFLALCEVRGIKSIVESGRGPDAYSTKILGLYAMDKGIPVVSIEGSPYPVDEELGDLSIRLMVGNTFDVLGAAMRGLPRPTALLVDGPKEFKALWLSTAASRVFNIKMIAHHNFHLEHDYGQEFRRVFSGMFYEGFMNGGDVWCALKKWERENTNGFEEECPDGRLSLSESSLQIGFPRCRWQDLYWRNQFRFHPLWLYCKWIFNCFRKF